MIHPFTRKARTAIAALAALAIAFTGLAAAPANAAPASSFTITIPETGEALSTITGTQGVPVNKTYDITFNDSGWDFQSQGNGNGYSFYNLNGQKGLNASVSFADSTHASMTVTGTPANGIHFNSYLELWDGTGNGYTFPFQVAIEATTPTPHLSVDPANHTYGDVAGLNTTGLFSSMPKVYLNTANSGTLVELTPADNLTRTTTINNGVTTISYTTDTVYNDAIYGSIRADVTITIIDGKVSYQVQTWSWDWEGDLVPAGDVVFQANLASGSGTSSGTAGGRLATFSAGHPFAVFTSVNGATPALSEGTVTLSTPSSNTRHSFEFSFFDYTGCPTLDELVSAYQGGSLNVTGYESATACAPKKTFTASPASGYADDSITVDVDASTWMLIGATSATFTSPGFALTVPVTVDDTYHHGVIQVPGLPEARDYTVYIESSGAPVGSFTYSYLGEGKTPPATPVAPGAVSSLTQTGATYGTVDIAYTAPADNGGSVIAGYNVYVDGAFYGTAADWQTDYRISGLTPETSYRVTVAAVTIAGEGPGTDVTATTVVPSFTIDQVASGNVGSTYEQSVNLNFTGFWSGQIASIPTATGLPGGMQLEQVCNEGCFFAFTGLPVVAGEYPVTVSMVLEGGVTVTSIVTVVIGESLSVGNPTVSFSNGTVHYNGSVDIAIANPAQGYIMCLFKGDQLVTCGPTLGQNGTLFGFSLYSAFGATTFTARIYEETAFGNIDFTTSYLSTASVLIGGPAAPVQIPTVLVTNPTAGSVDAAWNAISGAVQYLVYLDGTLVATVDGSTLSYSFTGLNAGTEYAIAVIARTETQDSDKGYGYGTTSIAPVDPPVVVPPVVVPPVVVPPVVVPPVVVPPVVIPPVVVAPVTEGTYAPSSTTSTTLGWNASKDADTVLVTVNGKTVAELPGSATGLVLGSLIGPKDVVEVIVKDAAGNASVLASFAYVPRGDIALGGVTFGADSAKLTASAKTALKKYAASIVAHGFTTATVAAFTKFDAARSASFRAKLAKARAVAITAYLNAQFKAAGATVKVTSTGKGVKARTGVVTTK